MALRRTVCLLGRDLRQTGKGMHEMGRGSISGRGSGINGVVGMYMLGGTELIEELPSDKSMEGLRVRFPSSFAYSVRKSDQCANFPPK